MISKLNERIGILAGVHDAFDKVNKLIAHAFPTFNYSAWFVDMKYLTHISLPRYMDYEFISNYLKTVSRLNSAEQQIALHGLNLKLKGDSDVFVEFCKFVDDAQRVQVVKDKLAYLEKIFSNCELEKATNRLREIDKEFNIRYHVSDRFIHSNKDSVTYYEVVCADAAKFMGLQSYSVYDMINDMLRSIERSDFENDVFRLQIRKSKDEDEVIKLVTLNECVKDEGPFFTIAKTIESAYPSDLVTAYEWLKEVG